MKVCCHRCGKDRCELLGTTEHGSWWHCHQCGFAFLAKQVTPSVKATNEAILTRAADRWMRSAS